MEPSAAIVTALVQGAAAALHPGTGTPAIEKSYQDLKAIITLRHPEVNLPMWETDPASAARQAVLEEDLHRGAAHDADLLRQAQALLALIQGDSPQTGGVTGASLTHIRAASLALTDVNAQGDAGVTGVAVQGADIAGDIRISQVRAGRTAAASGDAGQPAGGGAPQITILFLAANPLDTVQLRLDAEVRAIDESLQKAALRDRFDFQQHWALRVSDLQGLLLRHHPAVVHFCGHGDASGQIVLEDDHGAVKPVAGEALGQMFAVLGGSIRCVVLNACYTAQQAGAIAEYVPCVVGMEGEFGDEAAILFAAAFYQALGFGRDIETAFALGRARLALEGAAEQGSPQLLAPHCKPAQMFPGDGGGPKA